jgi:hypothetical protein
MLAPFSKKRLALTLRGITTDDRDLSVRRPRTSRCMHLIISHKVDLIRTVTLPHLEPFGITDGLELKVRGPFTHARAHAHAYAFSEDQETGFTSAGWRRSSISLSHRQASQNP